MGLSETKKQMAGGQIATDWKPFDYSDYECGLFWLLVESPDVDIDADDYGQMCGHYTGEVIRSTVLAMVEEGDEGLPEFVPVDRENCGPIDGNDAVTHFADVVAPAIPANWSRGKLHDG